jgi:membrane protein YdbS with pleckstrin-like domain
MAFPKKLLVPGEELVLDLRPHPVALALATIVTVLILVVGIWVLTLSWVHGLVGWLVAAFMIVGLIVYPVRRLVRWLTSHFVVTSDRVIHRQGLIAKESMEIPLEQINDIRFTQGVFERMIGAGDIQIRSASNDGPTTFEDVRNPEEVQKAIYHQSELNNQRMYSGMGTARAAGAAGAAGAAPGPGAGAGARAPMAPSTTTELERLADLRAKGVLTEAEFQAQKAKILGGG